MADFADAMAAEFMTPGLVSPPEQAQTTVAFKGNSIVTYVTAGIRYAAIGATQAAAVALLTTDPESCAIPDQPD